MDRCGSDVDDDGRPIFVQLAEEIADGIIDGTYPPDTPVPSTNEFAAFYRINPATALKAQALLVERGVLYKKRGIGMFVAPGARDALLAERREQFAQAYLRPLVAEARRLGITHDDLTRLISQEATP
jgi:DNA-binding transcriptional regulator YhcF (GntR family)